MGSRSSSPKSCLSPNLPVETNNSSQTHRREDNAVNVSAAETANEEPADEAAQRMPARSSGDVEVKREQDQPLSLEIQTTERVQPSLTVEKLEKEQNNNMLQLFLCLYRVSSGEKSVHQLDKLPASVGLLRKKIELEHHIPMFCQRIVYDSLPLSDDQILPFSYMRNDDVIEVHYKQAADVEVIQEVLTHLKDVIAILDQGTEKSLLQSMRAHPTEYLKLLNILRQKDLERLVYQLFDSDNEEQQEANLLFFLHNNGLMLLYRLHCLLLSQSALLLPQPLHYAENSLVTTLWSITDKCNQFGVRIEFSAIVMNIAKSSLRGEVTEKCPQFQHTFFFDTIYKATGALCNIAELPQYRIMIASNRPLMLQFLAVMQSSAYNYHTAMVTMAGLVCLSYSRETHQYLCVPRIIDGILETCIKRRQQNMQNNAILLRYFASLFFSFLITSSAAVINSTQLDKIGVLIAEFLKEADPQDIQEREKASGFYWLTLLPHVTLCYFPFMFRPPHVVDGIHTTSVIDGLYKLCAEVGVFSLQNTTIQKKHREVLVAEKLVGYIQCLSWYLLPELNAHCRACQLASDLKPLFSEPPSLDNIARAQLASHLGLEEVLDKQPWEIYNQLFPSELPT